MEELTEYERAVADVYDAKHEFQVAQSHFNNASDEFFDIANSQLTLATNKLNLAVQRARQLYIMNS